MISRSLERCLLGFLGRKSIALFVDRRATSSKRANERMKYTRAIAACLAIALQQIKGRFSLSLTGDQVGSRERAVLAGTHTHTRAHTHTHTPSPRNCKQFAALASCTAHSARCPCCCCTRAAEAAADQANLIPMACTTVKAAVTV